MEDEVREKARSCYECLHGMTPYCNKNKTIGARKNEQHFWSLRVFFLTHSHRTV